MSRKGNPVALIKAVRKNPNVPPLAKRKALSKLRVQAERMGQLPKARRHRNSNSDYFQTIKRSSISTFLWFVGLSAVGFFASFNQATTSFFSLGQIFLLLKDIGDTDKSRRLLSNFVAALMNGLIGWATGDGWYTLGAVVVGLIVIMKAVDNG
jgi:hypothetical protein